MVLAPTWAKAMVRFWLGAVPVTLLGCVSPFAIRLSMQDEGVESSGQVAGGLYALFAEEQRMEEALAAIGEQPAGGPATAEAGP